jgi:MFS family permease
LPAGRLIALVCAIEILSMAPLAAFPALIPVFRNVWAISNTEAGWISGVFFAGMLGAVALGTALTDRLDAKLVFGSGLAISALAALGFAGTAEDAWSAGFWRVLQGMGFGATYMPGLKLLTDLLPSEAPAAPHPSIPRPTIWAPACPTSSRSNSRPRSAGAACSFRSPQARCSACCWRCS